MLLVGVFLNLGILGSAFAGPSLVKLFGFAVVIFGMDEISSDLTSTFVESRLAP